MNSLFQRSYQSIYKSLSVIILLTLCHLAVSAQSHITGTIADADTRLPLPFATVKYEGSPKGIISDINGHFSLQADNAIRYITVSYIGYEPKTLPAQTLDTIFLQPLYNTFSEVVIKPPYDKIRRIVNTAIRNKDKNNPDLYKWYTCQIYYKMKVDLLPNDSDTLHKELKKFSENSHVMLTESYTRRYYRKPQQTQDVVLASRFSGLKKSLFTSLVTDVLPFHVYGDFIRLNEVDYANPIAPGWQSRYEFDIADELQSGDDTIYILKYRPKKNAVFKSLTGTVYINTNGYAISHIIAYSSDTATNSRQVKMEQIYRFTDGKWFPAELNYELLFRKFPDPQIGMVMSGHSIIDSVSFTDNSNIRFDKAHAIKLDSRIDERSPEEWEQFRLDSLTRKEQNTYVIIDSISKENHLDQIFSISGKAATGKIPVGPVDIDLKRILAFNTYEGTRLGLGLYSNEKVSRYFSAGGWFGYGFSDKVWKYGSSLRLFPAGEKDHWIEAGYQKNYQNTGSINIHRELDRNGLRNWLLARVDQITEVSGTLHGRFGYWELEVQGRQQELKPRYDYIFNAENSNNKLFRLKEGSLNIRYAYSERRTPIFGEYLPLETKYPIFYLRLSAGDVSSGNYQAQYGKALAAITYKVHINRWGMDNFRLDAGIVKTKDKMPLPRSFLMAGNGFRINERIQPYAWGGFLTLLPYTYFSDKYISLIYRHDFDRSLYESKYSKPFISLAYNVLYGSLNKANELANTGIQTPYNGYHESGILLNQLLRLEYLNIAYVNLNAGVYYHWKDNFDFNKNGRFVIGLSANF